MSAAPLALVGYYEPWWIQILKGIVIFAVALQLTRGKCNERSSRRAKRCVPLPIISKIRKIPG